MSDLHDQARRGRPAIVSRPAIVVRLIFTVEQEMARRAARGDKRGVAAACRAIMCRHGERIRIVVPAAAQRYNITSATQLRQLYYGVLKQLAANPETDPARWLAMKRQQLAAARPAARFGEFPDKSAQS